MFFFKLSGYSSVSRLGIMKTIISSKDSNILDAFLILWLLTLKRLEVHFRKYLASNIYIFYTTLNRVVGFSQEWGIADGSVRTSQDQECQSCGQ